MNPKMRMAALFTLVFTSLAARADLILEKNSGLPVTTFNLTFRVGSADDPAGHEGLAYLTARLIREGGVKAWKKLPARSRAELEDFLFPLAADIDLSVGKEQTSFRVTSTAADAETLMNVLTQLALKPAFSPQELERLKDETLDELEKQLPREDEEELGKAALDFAIYGKTHPYSHVVQGTVEGVKSITPKMVADFFRRLYTRQRTTLGISGVVSAPVASGARALLQRLPGGTTSHAEIPPAPETGQRDLLIVKGPFEATGVHVGQALAVTRASKDFPAMYLAGITFGKHRSFVGRLMRVVREIRGLNYGAYAYVEDFPRGGQLMTEPTQAARTRQAFTVWGRPTPENNGCFLTRQLAREAGSLAIEGLTPEEFDLGHSHLMGNIPLLGASLERHLGYAIDSVFYGLKGDYLANLVKGVQDTTRDSVNATLKKYLHPEQYHFVVVTPDPDKLKQELLSPQCQIHYGPGVEKPQDVLAEDKLISTYSLGIDPSQIRVVEAESLFRR